ncbi:hypothetical protein CBS101457_005199 [Exobasidium rhododendri]|nr:hypothetical protein CBS101457_005199 [Exobasidium rhododendri]
MADDQAALIAQIRALSGAIDKRKSSSRGGGYNHGSIYQQSSHRGGSAFEKGHAAGPANATSSRHRSLVLSGTGAANRPSQGHDQSTPAIASTSATATTTDPEGATSGDEEWVKRKSTHNMSLVSSSAFKKTEPARLAAIAATQSAKSAAIQKTKSAKGTQVKAKGSNSVRRGDRMGEVIVDGVVFEFDESGTKLVKKDPQIVADGKDQTSTSAIDDISTPLRTSVDGQKYVRTKTGNLISQELLDKRRLARKNNEKIKRLGEMGKNIGDHQRIRDSGRRIKSSKVVRKRGLCSFYNKTGQCKRGLSCPYVHNPDRLAICPGILRPSGCVLPTGSCPLSHDKRPERVPHCVHFLRLKSCRNGDECVYTHPSPDIDLSNESAICMDFSDLGWCESGSKCTQRHTWDCPEFLREGSCSRKGCKLMHVVRVENLKKREDEDHDLADDELFLRDDGAAEARQKRKRGNSEEDEDVEEREAEEAEEGEEKEGGNHSPTWKAKKVKDFVRQQDFISFTDEEDEGQEEEEESQSASEEENDHESVHSDSSQE